MQYIEWAMWTGGTIMRSFAWNIGHVEDLNNYGLECLHGIEWKPAKQKLRKEIMALTFAKGRDICELFS